MLRVQATEGARCDSEQRIVPLFEDGLIAERAGVVGEPVRIGAASTTELLFTPGGRAMGRAGAMGGLGGKRHAALGIARGAGHGG